MSTTDQPQEGQPPKDKQEAFLSPPERAELQRLMKDPTEYPREMGSWIQELISVNGVEIPISQIRGFTRFTAKHEATAATGSIAQADYGDLNTGAGPVIDGLAEGTFLAIFGAFLNEGSPINREGCMRLAINGESLGTSDTDAARGFNGSNLARAVVLDVRGGGNNNIVRAKYRSASAGAPSINFQNRWMVLLRIGN